MTIELTLSGDGSSLDKGGEGLLLSGHDGEPILRYRGFLARDASGRPLRMAEKLDGNRLLLTIEESGAKYPITVDPWVQLAKLTSSDPLAYNFGLAVAISGKTVVVGAQYATVGSNHWQGAAYVFVKPESGWTNMTQTAMLTASNGVSYDTFGLSVAIDGNTIVVGDPSYGGHGIGGGAAFVFVKPPSGWTNMTQTATLRDDGTGDWLGGSVAVSGDTVVATSDITQNHGEGPGVAYVYVKPPGGWIDAKFQTATLNPSDGKPGDAFGYSSSISGDTVVVGSPSDLTPGAAYVFVKPQSGWPQTMTETAKLTASDGKGNDFFGLSVTTDATTAVVGAPYAPWRNNFGPGAAYVFVKPPSGWKNTTERAKLTATGGKSGDYFGNSLSLSGDLLAIGAPLATVGGNQWQGLTYLFRKPKDGWKTTSQFAAKVASAYGAVNDNFGFSVSLSGTTVVAGAPYASTNAGYVFQNSTDVVAFGSLMDSPAAEQGSTLPPAAPHYCNPCLFYGGDMDPGNQLTGDLSNEMDLINRYNAVYAPFIVPQGTQWTVTGVFTNNLSTVNRVDPAQSYWEIREGVSSGNIGTLVASGTGAALYFPTGRNEGGFFEFTTLVKGINVPLQAGTYWLSVVPECTNTNDYNCNYAGYYENTVEDDPPLHHYGPLEPSGESFFNCYQGGSCEPMTRVCGSIAVCTRFSEGVLGKQN